MIRHAPPKALQNRGFPWNKSGMLINPRLTDYYGIAAPQASLDFAIPFFNEDIPLYVDPFLLWRYPSQVDQGLHTSLINSFNHLGYLARRGNRDEAVAALILASECDEVGLGSSAKRKPFAWQRIQAV
jgi:hypothetical protein